MGTHGRPGKMFHQGEKTVYWLDCRTTTAQKSSPSTNFIGLYQDCCIRIRYLWLTIDSAMSNIPAAQIAIRGVRLAASFCLRLPHFSGQKRRQAHPTSSSLPRHHYPKLRYQNQSKHFPRSISQLSATRWHLRHRHHATPKQMMT